MLSESDDIAVKDPVCGEVLDMADVAESELHEGWAYYFCSVRCRERFSKSPSSFAPVNQTPTTI